MKRKIAGSYSIILGVAVIILWFFIFKNQNIPEGKTALFFHVFSEFLMAFTCILSGIMMLRKTPYAKPVNLLALGMVIYSVLNAAGYYGGKGDLAMLFLFSVLFVLTLVVAILSLRSA